MKNPFIFCIESSTCIAESSNNKRLKKYKKKYNNINCNIHYDKMILMAPKLTLGVYLL